MVDVDRDPRLGDDGGGLAACDGKARLPGVYSGAAGAAAQRAAGHDVGNTGRGRLGALHRARGNGEDSLGGSAEDAASSAS